LAGQRVKEGGFSGRRSGVGENFGMIGVKSELSGDPMAAGFNGKGVYLSYTLHKIMRAISSNRRWEYY